LNNCQQIYVLRVSCLKLEINEFRCYEAKIQIDPTINELIYTSKLMLHKMNSMDNYACRCKISTLNSTCMVAMLNLSKFAVLV